MSYLDIFLGGLLIYGFVRGFWNGFFIELASFVSLLLGIYVAIKFSYIMKSIVANHVSWNPKSIQIVAFILTFILVVIGISLLAKFLTKIANKASLGIVNKVMGSVFGLLKMILMLSVLLSLFQKINFDYTFAKKSTIDNSYFFNPIQKTAEIIYPSIEEWYKGFKVKAIQ
ncbi:MAG: CvpA family protein [Flavobacterium sp.]|nr:CvpA family protein [Flavobacterium sp.]